MAISPIELAWQRALSRLSHRENWLCRPLARLELQFDEHLIGPPLCDGRSLVLGPEFENLDEELRVITLAHIALHLVLGHYRKNPLWDADQWTWACDTQVNALLMQSRLEWPVQLQVPRQWQNLDARKLYHLNTTHADHQWLDTPRYASWEMDQLMRDSLAAVRPEARESQQQQPPGRLDELEVDWPDLMQAAQQARHGHGGLAALVARQVMPESSEDVNWRQLLARYLNRYQKTDFSYARPSRRESEAIMPGWQDPFMDIHVAVDTSASVSDRDLQRFVGAIDEVKRQLNARITLHACDAQLDRNGPWYFDVWQSIEAPALQGRGGTRFEPVFEYLANEGSRPDVLIYFTDGEGIFPTQMADFPVIWAVLGDRTPPWGDVLRLKA